MAIPIKKSNYISFDKGQFKDYVQILDFDLAQLYSRFNTEFHVANLRVGGSTNYTLLGGTDGNLTFYGTNKKYLTMRPALNAGKIAGAGKPTAVNYGAFSGYSLPIYNNDGEELFFRDFIPGRWDGTSDIICTVKCLITNTEDVGDKFKLQLSWANKECETGQILTTTTDIPIETTIATGLSVQYSLYCLNFTIDWNLNTPNIVESDILGLRIRRIAASGSEVSNEIAVLDVSLKYSVDKVFKNS